MADYELDEFQYPPEPKMILLLPILPLLLFFTTMTLLVHNALGLRNELESTCYDHLLTTQRQVSQNLIRLMDMNPEAQELSIQRRVLESELEIATASGDVASAEIYEIKLSDNLIQQEFLHERQLSEINTANSRMLFFSSSLKQEIQTQLNEHVRQNDLIQVSATPRIEFRENTLAVHAESTETAPTYAENTNFSQEQSLGAKIQWQQKLNRSFSSIYEDDISQEVNCYATLKPSQERQTWTPVIFH